MGYKGHKVGIFVLPEINTTRDTHKADGAHRFRMRLLEKSNQSKIKTAAVAVDDVVKYDIEKLKLDLNDNFKFNQVLDSQIQLDSNLVKENSLDFSGFSDFGAKFIGKAADYIESLKNPREIQKIDSMI